MGNSRSHLAASLLALAAMALCWPGPLQAGPLQGKVPTRPAGRTANRLPAPLRKFVFTGGPGVGKTTMIKGLAKKGYAAIPEAPRRIIWQEQLKERAGRFVPGLRYKGVLPWTDLVGFQHKVLRLQQRWEKRSDARAYRGNELKKSYKGTVLDRSFVDPLAYLLESGMTPKSHPALYAKIFRQIKNAGYCKVFFLDRLPTYVNDSQRKESTDHAGRLHERLFQVYTEMSRRFGFEVIRVPALPVNERLEYVQRRMGD